jgi:prolyl-tRNA synthetase
MAPADVHVIATGKDDAVFEAGEVLVAGLSQVGLTVLYDDRRGPSPGVKFNDSELIGVPTIVVVGKRLGDGVVEIKDRATGERHDVELADAISRIVQIVRPGGS